MTTRTLDAVGRSLATVREVFTLFGPMLKPDWRFGPLLAMIVIGVSISNTALIWIIGKPLSAIQTGQGVGMQTLDQCLLELVRQGAVSKQDARMRAVNKDSFT